ncbi:MAG: hypothetical protein WBC51_05280 [Vicinamibacterales bacterium]
MRDAIALADRRRRRHHAALRLWRAAPWGAAVCLGLAGVSRLVGWPAFVPLSILAASFVAFCLFVFFSGRPRSVSDDIAAAIDADASLAGELRSASWFAAREKQNEWIDFHLERAAHRLEGTDWSELYPPIRSPHARAATAALVVAAIGVAVLFPEYTGFRSRASAQTPATQAAPGELPKDLQQALEALLAAAEAGTLDEQAARLSSAEMQELLTKLRELRDTEALKELSHAMNPDAESAPPERSAEEMKALAERLRHAADINPGASEFRKTVEELAKNLSEAAAAEDREIENARNSRISEEPGELSQAPNASGANEPTIQSLKESQSAAGADSVIMMSNKDANAAGPPGFGVGGSGSTSGAAKPTEIEAALRQETIEANVDTEGPNVEAQVRRKTEQGQATATFTHGAAERSDRSRATAPPQVPEGRRSDIQRYFIRKQ